VPRQLLLDFNLRASATFDNFIAGDNTELVSRLTLLDQALAAAAAHERSFYLWGEAGCGRSHLLQALCHHAEPGRARLITPSDALAAFAFEETTAIYALDDCHALSPSQQLAAFNLFNAVQTHPHTALVAAGHAPPRMLMVREDLRTRFGWGLVFRVALLDDTGKLDALAQIARARGMRLTANVLPYLLAHCKRDMPTLIRLLDALDRFSLELKRPLTLPLVQAMLTEM
jgi:DnaA-homolog protein